ncbi:hypothetical protein Ae717Ps2_6362 [Pseudonocardia sp. Ae717_Ps2]|nr:hypothetical protein Ae717Ps2_6362 [Pseudonocardia sp. Ae717_Ps2]
MGWWCPDPARGLLIPASVDRQIGYSAGQTAPGGIYGLLEANGTRSSATASGCGRASRRQEEAIALDLPLGAPVVVLAHHAIDQDGKVVEYFDRSRRLTGTSTTTSSTPRRRSFSAGQGRGPIADPALPADRGSGGHRALVRREACCCVGT